MSSQKQTAGGLTRIILESLVNITPEIVASGQSVDDQLLQEVEDRVHQSLAPKEGTSDKLIFDMVFKRSFAEARELFNQALDLSFQDQPGKSLSQGRVMA